MRIMAKNGKIIGSTQSEYQVLKENFFSSVMLPF